MRLERRTIKSEPSPSDKPMEVCRWKDAVWLGAAVHDIGTYCEQLQKGHDRREQQSINESTSRVYWLEKFVTNLKKEDLRTLYQQFRNQDVIGGCEDEGRNLGSITWEDLVNNVLQAMEPLTTFTYEPEGTVDPSNDKIKGASLDWRDILSRKLCQGSAHSPEWMGLLICLVNIWGQTMTGNPNLSKMLPPVCQDLLQEIEMPKCLWDSWLLETLGEKLLPRQTTESPVAPNDEIQGKIGLILSIYGGISKLCQTCGPYELSQLVESQDSASGRKQALYCIFDKGTLECGAGLQHLSGRTNYLIYRDLEGVKSGTCGEPGAGKSKAVLNDEEAKSGVVDQKSAATDPRTTQTSPTEPEVGGHSMSLINLGDANLHSPKASQNLAPTDGRSPNRKSQEEINADSERSERIYLDEMRPKGGDHNGQIALPSDDPSPSGLVRVKTARPSLQAGEPRLDPSWGGYSGVLGGGVIAVMFASIGLYGFWRIGSFKSCVGMRGSTDKRHLVGYGSLPPRGNWRR
ncbi:hypothetical protein C922_05650 [Plasmodium inui San Antonio 1]|uniref:Uncharacterized protein n=1 Tax=Plasmodium inui San Antonio 1 TaxID=1237626 RepID=W7AFA6_9APIC|nr:hypothetical protein C922_05650 [Plasmodium inui San Antonio 1]EUD63971.1 hypothetical protein C922_05650 [Plasmodium inui San Antonio 1]